MKRLLPLTIIALTLTSCQNQPAPKLQTSQAPVMEWPCYGNDAGGMRYSPAKQINRENVKDLKVAWTYRTGESPKGAETNTMSECTPLMVEGTLYVCTPLNQVIALNPETGKELWRFDPKVPNHHYANGPTCRGVSTWRDQSKPADNKLARLIFVGTNDGRLIAIDAKTGEPQAGFGNNGEIDLKKDIIEHGAGNYQVTSPPAIIGNLVVVGSAINDNWYTDEARGTVRAYDVISGKLRWSWDPIPRNVGDPGYDTWENGSNKKTGGANVWSIISVDEQRDLVFLPTTSPSVDYYGGERDGENLYANSVVALKGSTGEFVWGFQVVHHDIWDYDIPAQPTLIDLTVDGKVVPALVQGTKMGNLYVLNRETGKPLYPIEERPVPQSAVAGEKPWPTQPFPTFPKPIVPQHVDKDALFGIDEEERAYAQETFSKLHYEGMFTPGSEQGTLVFPGNIGGIAWGGVAYDPENQLVIANTNRLAAIVTLVPREKYVEEHGKPGQGNVRELNSIEKAAMYGTPYVLKRAYFVSPKGVPCVPPPWGALAAIDLKNGEKKWEVPLGILDALKDNPDAKKWGSPGYGGPLVTAGGLIFIAATMDDHLRAFDRDTGELLWQADLPAGAQATPMTYSIGGTQYVVINAGGHGRLKTTPGDYFVAYKVVE